MYVISSHWVIKLWEFSFPKLKIKITPFFLISRICVSHWKKYPFLAKWVRAWMYALVETDGTGQTWGVPSGVLPPHYNDVIMGSMASQLTSLTIVYSTVYMAANQRKHQSSASLAFVRWIHRGPVNSPHKWPVTRKLFPFDDVIMKFEPNPISLYRNAWELLDQWWDGQSWDSNAGSSAERGLKLIRTLESPTKVDLNSINRFCANSQTWCGGLKAYI